MAIFDVDGVLTDGTLFLTDGGEEIKAFNSHDGHGLKMLKASGVKIALITGRKSRCVELKAGRAFPRASRFAALEEQFLAHQYAPSEEAPLLVERCGLPPHARPRIESSSEGNASSTSRMRMMILSTIPP